MERKSTNVQNTNANTCFRYDEASQSAICRVSKDGKICRQRITNNHHGNKMRHLRIKHPNIYNVIQKNKRKKKIVSAGGDLKVSLSIEKLYASFIELVTKNGRPFCICMDSGIRLLIDPILDGIHKATGEKFTINPYVLKQKVGDVYEFIVHKIVDEAKSKPISLMLDISTKHNYSILGISIRYHTENGPVTRVIGMVPLTNRHTSHNIFSTTKEILIKFEIKSNQIIASTTDNAYNVVNVSDHLDTDCNEHMMNEGYILDDHLFALLNDEFFADLLNRIRPMMENENPHVTFIPCGAHTLQLAVNFVLQNDRFLKEIDFVKDRVKTLRTQTIVNLLRQKNLKQAVMNHDIRWNYTYLMVVLKYFLFLIE